MFKDFKVTKENIKESELLLKIIEFVHSLGYKKQKEVINELKRRIKEVNKNEKI